MCNNCRVSITKANETASFAHHPKLFGLFVFVVAFSEWW